MLSYAQVPRFGLSNRVRIINQNRLLRTLTSKETIGVFPRLELLFEMMQLSRQDGDEGKDSIAKLL